METLSFRKQPPWRHEGVKREMRTEDGGRPAGCRKITRYDFFRLINSNNIKWEKCHTLSHKHVCVHWVCWWNLGRQVSFNWSNASTATMKNNHDRRIQDKSHTTATVLGLSLDMRVRRSSRWLNYAAFCWKHDFKMSQCPFSKSTQFHLPQKWL